MTFLSTLEGNTLLGGPRDFEYPEIDLKSVTSMYLLDDTPLGDLARDIEQDESCPKNIFHFLPYIYKERGCAGAVDEARILILSAKIEHTLLMNWVCYWTGRFGSNYFEFGGGGRGWTLTLKDPNVNFYISRTLTAAQIIEEDKDIFSMKFAEMEKEHLDCLMAQRDKS